MANSLPPRLATGTVGELLVQLRLLQFGVQAAAPIKDSGNDLVALRGYEVRTIQVKTSRGFSVRVRKLPDKYHLLALVFLRGDGSELHLDQSEIFLVPRDHVAELGTTLKVKALRGFRMSQALIDELFPVAG